MVSNGNNNNEQFCHKCTYLPQGLIGCKTDEHMVSNGNNNHKQLYIPAVGLVGWEVGGCWWLAITFG